MVTSRDVAKLAGVSQATVSRALSSQNVSPSTRARVLAAMDELGYMPHAGAQALKTRRSNVIGVVVSNLTNPFYAELLDELSNCLDEQGFRVVLWKAGGSSHNDALKAIGEHAVDGVIFATATSTSPELSAAVSQGRPLVLINRDVEGIDCDRVISENRVGGATVADFLVENKRFDVAVISGDTEATTSRDRSEGFIARMKELGYEVPEHLQFNADFSYNAANQVARLLLRRTQHPTAFFCINDYMAFGVIDAIRERGLSRDSCWVVGYDDIEMSAWPSYDLTTIRQPSRQMAQAGAQLLIEKIRNPSNKPRTFSFPSSLIERGSTPSRA